MRYQTMFVFVLLSFFAVPSLAESLMSIQRNARNDAATNSPELQQITLKGLVRSQGEHDKSEVENVEFVEEKTGRIFSLSNSEELAELHGEQEKDLLVILTAQKVPKFLFWGGGLKVASFELLDVQQSAPHISQHDELHIQRTYRNR
ncbi:MAG: hypothetical protein AABZ31_11370 [Bdellovibrionota bacterium]